MRKTRNLKTRNSGQLLILAALAIAILISTTTIYVYEVNMETRHTSAQLSVNDFIFAVKQSSRSTLISSLANISNGGETTVLANNLNKLSQVFGNLTNFGIVDLTFKALNNSDYDEGIRLSWDTEDVGISSVYVNFTLKIYGITANMTMNYDVNITTTITFNGYYTILESGEKAFTLTCNVYNEGKPALAKNMTLFYESLGSWIQVNASNNLAITDYGNGTYAISFTANVTSSAVQVSAHLHDLRGIFVLANTTCYEA